MRITVEAQQRAVTRVLELEDEGITRAEANRRVASRAGVAPGRLRRWVEEHQERTSAAPGPGAGAATGPLPVLRSRRRVVQPVPLLRASTAAGTALAVGADVLLKVPFTTTSLLAAVLLPVWLPHLRRYRGAVHVVWLGVAAVLAGWAMAALSTTHASDPVLAQAMAVWVLNGVGAVGLLLWVRTVLGTDVMALLVGLGMLASIGLDGVHPINPWKFQLSLPVTTIVLAVAARWRQPVLSAGALVALAVVGLANDSRSYAGFAVMTAAVVLWQTLPARSAGRSPTPLQRLQLAVVLVMGVVGASSVGQVLLVGGALGAEVQARSQEQVEAGGGSLLLGGRVELQATAELVPAHPWGFGLGAVPNQEDVLLAKEGLARVGIQPGNGYVDRYMFGGHIELHSVVADLWANCGVVGALFGLTMLLVLLDALVTSAAARRASAQAVFWVASAVWFLGFGPLYTNMPDVAFALAVALVPAAFPRPLSAASARVRRRLARQRVTADVAAAPGG